MRIDVARIARIREEIAAEFDSVPGDREETLRQIIAVAEESGEFVGAARRYYNMARRSGTFEEMAQELADLVITAFIFAEIADIDLGAEIETKLDIIEMRGYREMK
jgi:NTP pyrophosphatase (non-canonical NTP hydrolase)